MQDVILALRTHLLTVGAVTTLTSTRIYAGELPPNQIASMPQKLLVIRFAGGIEVFRTAREQKPRVDFFAYGEGYFQAGQVDRAVSDALIAIRRLDVADTLIHSVGYGGGPRQLKEPETGGRYVVRTASVIAGETSTA